MTPRRPCPSCTSLTETEELEAYGRCGLCWDAGRSWNYAIPADRPLRRSRVPASCGEEIYDAGHFDMAARPYGGGE